MKYIIYLDIEYKDDAQVTELSKLFHKEIVCG